MLATPAPALRTLTTAKGKSVQTPYSDVQALSLLSQVVQAGSGPGFAAELLQKSQSQRGLSPDQLVWAHILALQAIQPTPLPAAPVQSAPASPQLLGVLPLFQRAGSHLKQPRLTLLAGDQRVLLAQAGTTSRYAGQLHVSDGVYPNGRYFGRIDLSGHLWARRDLPGEVEALLYALADDPAGTAALQGQLTGRCCFCNLLLSDPRSTEVGYGRVCSQNWGLPY